MDDCTLDEQPKRRSRFRVTRIPLRPEQLPYYYGYAESDDEKEQMDQEVPPTQSDALNSLFYATSTIKELDKKPPEIMLRKAARRIVLDGVKPMEKIHFCKPNVSSMNSAADDKVRRSKSNEQSPRPVNKTACKSVLEDWHGPWKTSSMRSGKSIFNSPNKMALAMRGADMKRLPNLEPTFAELKIDKQKRGNETFALQTIPEESLKSDQDQTMNSTVRNWPSVVDNSLEDAPAAPKLVDYSLSAGSKSFSTTGTGLGDATPPKTSLIKKKEKPTPKKSKQSVTKHEESSKKESEPVELRRSTRKRARPSNYIAPRIKKTKNESHESPEKKKPAVRKRR